MNSPICRSHRSAVTRTSCVPSVGATRWGKRPREVEATAHVVWPPVCTVVLHDAPRAELLDDGALPGVLHDGATISEDGVDLRQAGYVTIPHDACFELAQPLTRGMPGAV